MRQCDATRRARKMLGPQEDEMLRYDVTRGAEQPLVTGCYAFQTTADGLIERATKAAALRAAADAWTDSGKVIVWSPTGRKVATVSCRRTSSAEYR